MEENEVIAPVIEEEVQDEQTGSAVVEDTTTVVAPKKAPKRRRTRRTPATIIRSAFPHAPADLIKGIENYLAANTLAEMRELEPIKAEASIDAAFARYAGRLIGSHITLTKSFEKKLREHAQSGNIDYDSLFAPRAAAALVQILRKVAGGGTFDDILEALE